MRAKSQPIWGLAQQMSARLRNSGRIRPNYAIMALIGNLTTICFDWLTCIDRFRREGLGADRASALPKQRAVGSSPIARSRFSKNI